MGLRHELINCKTIDGIMIKGWFYSVEGAAPERRVARRMSTSVLLSHYIILLM